MQICLRKPLSAALVTILGYLAPHAAAEVVIYDNSDGTFQWQGYLGGFPGATGETILDITQPPTQSGAQSQPGLAFEINDPHSSLSCSHNSIGPYGTDDIDVVLSSEGQPVGPNSDWHWSVTYSEHGFDETICEGLLLGPNPFIGVRLTRPDGDHFGWLELVPHVGGRHYVPVAWGWETEPGVAIIAGQTPPACICEQDGTAAVDVFDLLAYLDLWFAADGGADLDGAPGVDVFDLLYFLDCWFPASAGEPCP